MPPPRVSNVSVARSQLGGLVDTAGTANRTVGATLMNATSSRAHTVLQINFRQVVIDGPSALPCANESSTAS